MRMRLALAAALLTIGGLVSATAAQAVTYDLSADYSDAVNPTGTWSYHYNNALLPHVPNPGLSNPLGNAISSNGYFSTGNDLNLNTPDVLKATVNGSSAGGTNNDFMQNDIVIHSPNDPIHPLTIVWTAPSAGTVNSFTFSTWYAHSSVDRSNDVKLSTDISSVTTQLVAWTISKVSHGDNSLANVATFTGGPFNVSTGDTILLSFLETAGQSFGSLNGVAASVNFAPVATPIPAALPLLMTALAGLGWAGHRRRKQAV
jgi:hypothetical protein